MENLFAEDKIFEQHGAARASFQVVLIVGDGDALIGGDVVVGACDLVGLTPLARFFLAHGFVFHIGFLRSLVEYGFA